VVTTDPAAHLEDIFGEPVGHEPTSVGKENLDAARIDQEKALAEYREQVLDHVTEMYENKEDTQIDVDAAIANVEEELESPCAEEMAALEKFVSYFDGTATTWSSSTRRPRVTRSACSNSPRTGRDSWTSAR